MCRELCKEMDIAFLKHSDWKCALIQPPFYGGALLDLCLRSTLCWTVVPHTFYPNTEEAESVRSLREFQVNQDNMEKPRLGCGEERKRRRRKNCVMGSFRERANVNCKLGTEKCISFSLWEHHFISFSTYNWYMLILGSP